METDINEFYRQSERMDAEKIRQYLYGLSSPCYESQLLRQAFPDLSIMNASPLTLYRCHFLLFNMLYRLQEEFYKENMYLHVHFMRTFLAVCPDSGKCRFYDEHSGMFCRAETTGNEVWCDFHLRQTGDLALDELSAKYFYLDAENYFHLDEETATAFMNGTWELLSHYGDYEKSLRILGIRGTPDMNTVKRRFRELAKKHHPDRGALSHEKFNEINRAYRLLLRILAMR